MRIIKLCCALLLGVSVTAAAQIDSNEGDSNYEITPIAQDLDFPWGIGFLPNGDRLVTELSGQLRRISHAGEVSEPIKNVPAVFRKSQGGLFDVLVDPYFDTNNLVYLSYAAGNDESNATTVARAELIYNQLENVEVIFQASPKKYAPLHYGGRMIWMPDGTILLTTGDGFDFREKAQDLTTHFGKTIRLNRDGSAAAGNPFPAHPYIYTYGHRNPQGLTISKDGTVYLNEHGPKGGDEINILKSGLNYGWPAITYGMDYNGAYVSPLTEYPGMEQPQHVWTPSIAPSGFMIYEGNMFPQWQGDLFVGALVDAEVRHVEMTDGKVSGEQAIFPEISERIRDIKQGPDGSIYVLTDGAEGDVLRISKPY